MATTSIHAIKQTVGVSLDYVMNDKTEPVPKDDIADSIAYAVNDKTGEVTYYTLTSTQNCASVFNPVQDFYALMDKYGEREIKYGNSQTKDGKPVIAWHLIQSFEGEVDPMLANEVGRKLTEEVFGRFPAVISTHTNTENTHNHIVICAWNLDGKKWNQCNENYRRIREQSDKLCDEYGLSVLEHTRNQKLVRWTDEQGKIHYYEPTDRKNELIKMREEGVNYPDDVGSYRNTISYEMKEGRRLSNIETVKQAIDDLLPYATSYEHLLAMLREQGFTVKDKKKNGDWLAHITFTSPTAEKGVRDNTIDKENNFYCRENLTVVIEEQNRERRRNEELQAELNLPVYENYVYGEIDDVQGINEDYRATYANDGSIKIVQRGEAERDIIRDIKQSDREIYGLYDTSKIDKIIKEQREAAKKGVPAKNRNEILIRQIQESFENLKFIERKQLYSYDQINEIVRGLWAQYNLCGENIRAAEAAVDKLETVFTVPSLLSEVKNRIEQGKGDVEYMTERYPQDMKLLKTYADTLTKYKITDNASFDKLKEDVAKYREQIAALKISMDKFSKELADYNRCIHTLERIDKEREARNAAEQVQQVRYSKDRGRDR